MPSCRWRHLFPSGSSGHASRFDDTTRLPSPTASLIRLPATAKSPSKDGGLTEGHSISDLEGRPRYAGRLCLGAYGTRAARGLRLANRGGCRRRAWSLVRGVEISQRARLRSPSCVVRI